MARRASQGEWVNIRPIRRARGWWIGLLSFALTAGVMLAQAPAAHAQAFSDSYNFLKAVRERDGAKAKQLIDRPGSISVNSRDPATGESGLHVVVKGRDQPWLGFLLVNGANMNLRDNQGNTPLMAAASIGNDEAADLLLRVGAAPNLANSRGETPLITAVQTRNVNLVRLLLAAGADPRQTDNVAGYSAHDYAARDPRAAAILKLLDAAPVAKPRKAIGPSL